MISVNPDYVGFTSDGIIEFFVTVRSNMGSAFSVFLYLFLALLSIALIVSVIEHFVR